MDNPMVRKNEEPNMNGVVLECQTCGETVSAAFYDAKEAILRWECSDGHRSKIEEFAI